MCNLERRMILGLHGSRFLSHMGLIGRTKVMTAPALHMCSSVDFPLRHPLTMGRMESCPQTSMSAIGNQTLKSDPLGSLSNV